MFIVSGESWGRIIFTMAFKALQTLGDSTIYTVRDLGRMAVFLYHGLVGVFKRPFRGYELLRQIKS